jgi:porphobilinogen deaminase
LKKLDEGDYSAIILAEAGLNRMKSQNKAFIGRLTEVIQPSECLYAVGQVHDIFLFDAG